MRTGLLAIAATAAASLALAGPVAAQTASGRVTGTGRTRVLEYTVPERAGQKVTFVDVDSDRGATEIGTIDGGGEGRIAFRPALGRDRRNIEARFELFGIPAGQIAIARFRPPSPVLGRPLDLRARRSESKLLLRWGDVRGATRYQVVVTTSAGRQRVATVRVTHAAIAGVPASVTGTVSVQALDSGRSGPPATTTFGRR
jgi:hypothetical protein